MLVLETAGNISFTTILELYRETAPLETHTYTFFCLELPLL
jgi:hypothetical protein